jgi:hypothetical protein
MGGTTSSRVTSLDGMTTRWSTMLGARLGAWGTQGLEAMARVLIGRTRCSPTTRQACRRLSCQARTLLVPSIPEPLSACGTQLLLA